MGNWGNIPNQCNFQSCTLKCPDSCFSTGTRSAHHDLNLPHSLICGSSSRAFSSSLCGEGSSLFCPFKSTRTSTCPGDNISILIGNCDNAIVEGRLNVGNPIGYVPFLLFAPGFFCWLSGHISLVNLRYNLLIAASLEKLFTRGFLLTSHCLSSTTSGSSVGTGSLSTHW